MGEGGSRKESNLSLLVSPWFFKREVLSAFIRIIISYGVLPGTMSQMYFSPSLSIRLTRSSLLSAGKTNDSPLLAYFRHISTLQFYVIIWFTRK